MSLVKVPTEETFPDTGKPTGGVIQSVARKVCLIGAFAVGKTSTASRFLTDTFSDKYLTTVGVKIGSRDVVVDSTRGIRLVVWDIAGVDEAGLLRPSYLQGASGVIYVVDGTRRDTLTAALRLRDKVHAALGPVAAVLLVNKLDLVDQWEVTVDDLRAAQTQGFDCHSTSARSGAGVRDAFDSLARTLLL